MRILWATDGSDEALRAGRLIPHLCPPTTSSLTALAVIPSDPLPWLEAPILGTGHRIDRERETRLNAAIWKAAEAIGWPEERANVRTETGNVARKIVATAQEEHADLVVLGARHDADRGGLCGPTAAEVLTRAGQPVLVVQSDAPWRHIILATDGSPGARAAEAFLSRIDLAGATIHVVIAEYLTLVWDQPPNVAAAGAARIAADIASACTERLRQAGLSVGQEVVLPGRISDVIIAATSAVEADVVVMGTHGMTGWRRKVLGSVSGTLARVSPVSVLVAPPENVGEAAANRS
jgi:nucleotide-binding universal stress UspA family protein